MPNLPPSWYGQTAPRGGPPESDADFQDTEPNTDLTPPDDAEVWRHSSRELERGLDVDEIPLDTLPGELVEGLLPPRRRPT